MKGDVHGCSTCPPGQERYEQYNLSGMTGNRWTGADAKSKRTRVQYDYRTPDGELFSCIGLDLDDCRARRDAWLAAGRRYVSRTGHPLSMTQA